MSEKLRPRNYGIRELVSRVQNAVARKKQVTLLLGSGLTMPIVPGITQLTDRALDHYGADPGWFADESDRGATYQSLLAGLRAAGGVDTIEKLIQDIVLDACDPQIEVGEGLPAGQAQLQLRSIESSPLRGATLSALVEQPNSWTVSSAVDLLAKLLSLDNSPPFTVLTTNFDPLIEVAIRRLNIDFELVSVKPPDEVPARTYADQPSTSVPQVVHLHGRWEDFTRSNQHEIYQGSPLAVERIQRALSNDLVIAAGYGAGTRRSTARSNT